MKRPLAVFGFSWLLWMLCAARLPAGWLLPLAALPVAVFLVCVLLRGRYQSTPPDGPHHSAPSSGRSLSAPGTKTQHSTPLPLTILMLICAAGGLSLLLRIGFDAVLLRPALALAGETYAVSARVEDVQPGYGDDMCFALLRLLRVDEAPAPWLNKVEVAMPANVQIGDILSVQLSVAKRPDARRASYYADSLFLRATLVGPVEKTGHAPTFLNRMRLLQYAAGSNITARLPQPLASMMAAMSVGDKRFLSPETQHDFRAAGLSHILVVSGMHLSVLCMALTSLAALFLKNARHRALFCLAGLGLMMAFMGVTPSVLRSGVVWIFIFAGELSGRKADTVTSMAAAALLLLLAANPYAAADLGLQLSFAAAYGTVQANHILRARRLRHLGAPPPASWGQRAGRGVGRLLLPSLLTSVCVNVAIFPVLVLGGLQFSVLGIPVNLLVVPLLSPIVLCGFFMAIPGWVPVLGQLGNVAALPGGVLLRFLHWITALCGKIPWALQPLGGLFLFVVVMVVYLLVYLAWRAHTKQHRIYKRQAVALALAALLLVPSALFVQQALTRGTVQITLAGGGTSASVIVSKDGEAFVLYRGRQSLSAVQWQLGVLGVQQVALLVDMRASPDSTEAMGALHPKQVVLGRDIFNKKILSPLSGVDLYLKKQGEGIVACVDIEQYKIGVATSGANLQALAPLDWLIPGSAAVEGSYSNLLTLGAAPEWAEGKAHIYLEESGASLLIRPGKSVKLRGG